MITASQCHKKWKLIIAVKVLESNKKICTLYSKFPEILIVQHYIIRLYQITIIKQNKQYINTNTTNSTLKLANQSRAEWRSLILPHGGQRRIYEKRTRNIQINKKKNWKNNNILLAQKSE